MSRGTEVAGRGKEAVFVTLPWRRSDMEVRGAVVESEVSGTLLVAGWRLDVDQGWKSCSAESQPCRPGSEASAESRT